ncbi:hypothetical protein [Hyphomonas sp.]|uniref:hypothetical protein n=1 Tax=Hyphomonas sp. TaxID=87 RepID=UPI001BCE454C|nr:hypothetical protein [Hyphomonas sp.]
MLTNKNFRAVLLGCAAVALLGACSGADGVASPGVGAFVPPPAAPPPPPPPPPAPPPPTGGPAASCPTGFANVGVISDLRNCQLPSTITGNLVVPKVEGTIYSVSGRTQVGTDAGNNPLSPIPGSQQGILTIEPGVRIFGNSGGDYLLVNRGSQIFAEGTATDPIILTSRQSILGETNENSIGQWGGFIINGRAPITDGCPAGVTPPSASCEAQVEGSNAFYGGNSPLDNSGRIRYLRVQHSGFEIAPDNELNGITLAGVGSGTVFEYVQVHNSSDDGIEIFGGTVNIRYIVLTGNDDDSFDTDSGWQGASQFGIVRQRTQGGDYGFETSGKGGVDTFTTRPYYVNWTVIARSGVARDTVVHNSGHIGVMYNSILVHEGTGTQNTCFQLNGAATRDRANGFGTNGPRWNSVLFSCPAGSFRGAGGVTNAEVEAILNAGQNNVLNHTSTLTNSFVNGANEAAAVATAFPTTNSGAGAPDVPDAVIAFIQPANYVGAVRDANDTWYQGWSCGLPGEPAC